MSVVSTDITISGKLFDIFTILGAKKNFLTSHLPQYYFQAKTSGYTILLLFQVQVHSTIVFVSQDLVYFDHIT